MALYYFRLTDRVSIVAVGCWLGSLVCVCPVAIVSKLDSHWDLGEYQDFCVESWPSVMSHRIYIIGIFICFNILPAAGSAILLIKVWRSGNCHMAPVGGAWLPRLQGCRLLGALIGTFSFCWLPLHLIHLHNVFVPHSYFDTTIHILKITSYGIAYCYSAISPVLCIVFDADLNKAFRNAASFPMKKEGTFVLLTQIVSFKKGLIEQDLIQPDVITCNDEGGEFGLETTAQTDTHINVE